jgi:hypothetical protein
MRVVAGGRWLVAPDQRLQLVTLDYYQIAAFGFPSLTHGEVFRRGLGGNLSGY